MPTDTATAPTRPAFDFAAMFGRELKLAAHALDVHADEAEHYAAYAPWVPEAEQLAAVEGARSSTR